jgi:hypothetical protein
VRCGGQNGLYKTYIADRSDAPAIPLVGYKP